MGFGEPIELRQQDKILMPGFMKRWKRQNLSERTGPSTSDLSRIERSATWIDLGRRRKISRLNSTIKPKPRGQSRISYARSCMQPDLQPSRPVKLPMFSGAGARDLRSNSAVYENFRRNWRQPSSGIHRSKRPQGCAHDARARSRHERNRRRVREQMNRSSAAFRRMPPARAPQPDRDESPVAHRQWRAQFLLGTTGCSSRPQLTQIWNC